ncbi:MAG: hypothetical protein RL417_2488 [Pseudomonadota bacterium]
MFSKALNFLRAVVDSVVPSEPELKPGVVVDSLSQESFPARENIAAALDADIRVVCSAMASGMPVGALHASTLWELRYLDAEGEKHSIYLNEDERRKLIEGLRNQVELYGRVERIPLPRLEER